MPSDTSENDSGDEAINDIFDAIKAGDESEVKQRIQRDRMCLIEARNGKYPIHWAIEYNQNEIVSLLTQHPIDLNIKDYRGNTPLHLAIKTNRQLSAKHLLALNEDGSFRFDIDTDVQDRKNKTALDLIQSKLRKDIKWQEIMKLLDTASGTSSPNRKRQASDDELQANTKRQKVGKSGTKAMTDDGGVFKAAGTKVEPYLTYEKSGLSTSLHGVIYQLYLLMVFARRGLRFYHNFTLATEIDRAEKFDDVVINYQESIDDPQWTMSCLQAKHKQDPEKHKVTISQLTTATDGDFSLQKYFISFCKIKKSPEFRNYVLKDFVICTNTVLDLSEMEHVKKDGTPTAVAQKHNELIGRWKKMFTIESLASDNILYFDDQYFEAQVYRFNDFAKDELLRTVKDSLIETALQCQVVSKVTTVKDMIDSVKVLEIEPLILESENALKTKKLGKTHIVNVGRLVVKMGDTIFGKEANTDLKIALEQLIKSRADNKKDLSQMDMLKDAIDNVVKQCEQTTKKARKKLNRSKGTFQDQVNSVRTNNELSHFDKMLETARLNLINVQSAEDLERLSSLNKILPFSLLEKLRKKAGNHLEDAKSCLKKELDNMLSELAIVEILSSGQKLDETIVEFFEKIRLVFNYPGVEQLRLLIAREFGNEFNMLDAELVTCSFQKDILDWFGQYNKGRGEFLPREKANTLFECMEAKINSLMTCGLNKAFPEKLASYGISYHHDSLRTLAKSVNQFLKGDRQMLRVTSDFSRLTSIKVLQILSSSERFGKRDGFIFMNLKTLLRINIQQLAITSFKKSGSFDVLIIECLSNECNILDNRSIEPLAANLLHALRGFGKKIVIIAQSDCSLAKQLGVAVELTDNENRFSNLTKASKLRVLKTTVMFQGTELGLDQLLDTVSADSIVDGEILTNLVQGDAVEIGDNRCFNSVGYVAEYYIERKLSRQMINPEFFRYCAASSVVIIESLTSRFIDIKDIKGNACIAANDVYLWDHAKEYKIGETLVIRSDGDEVVEKIYKNNPEADIYLLAYVECNFYLKAYRGNFNKIEKYVDIYKSIAASREINPIHLCEEADFQSRVIIVANESGFGKSTLLTNMANIMRRRSPHLWIMRVNLCHFACKGSEHSLDLVDSNWSDEDAIDFIEKMVTSASNTVAGKFERKLFKATVLKTVKLDVVFFFDGFDEISPSYKENTITLLKAIVLKRCGQVWITSRIHTKSYLEQQLQSPAFVLTSFTERDQKVFLEKYWKTCLQFNDDPHTQIVSRKSQENIIQHLMNINSTLNAMHEFDASSVKNLKKGISDYLKSASESDADLQNKLTDLDFSGYIDLFLNRWNSSVSNKVNAFTSTPLLLRMTAEVVFDTNLRLPENMNLLSLYEKFVHHKLSIYYTEKQIMKPGNQAVDATMDRDSKHLRRIHEELAAMLLFPEECENGSLPISNELLRFEDDLEENKKSDEEISRVGLVTCRNGSLQFIHQSFAEFFFAHYLMKNLNSSKVQVKLLKEILIEFGHYPIRRFVNEYLKMYFSFKCGETDNISRSCRKNFSKLIAVRLSETSNKFFENFKEYYEDQTFIHVCASEGNESIIKFLFEKYTGKVEILRDMSSAATKNDFTAFSLASSSEVIKILLEILQYDSKSLRDVVVAQDQDRWTIIHSEVDRNNGNTLQWMLDWIKTNLEHQYPDAIKSLLTKNEVNINPLHSAALHGNMESIKVLLDWGIMNLDDNSFLEMVGCRDSELENVLGCAAQNGDISNMLWLITWIEKNIENRQPGVLIKMITTPYHANPLNMSIWSGQFEMFHWLLKWIDEKLGEKSINVIKEIILGRPKEKTSLHWVFFSSTNVFLSEVDKLKFLLNWVDLNLAPTFPGILEAMLLKRGENEETALHFGVEMGNWDLIEYLLQWIKSRFGNELLNKLVLMTTPRGTVFFEALFWNHHYLLQMLFKWMKNNLNPHVLKSLVLITCNGKTIFDALVHRSSDSYVNIITDFRQLYDQFLMGLEQESISVLQFTEEEAVSMKKYRSRYHSNRIYNLNL